METAIIFICVVGLLVVIVWLFYLNNDEDDNDSSAEYDDYDPSAEYDDYDEPDTQTAHYANDNARATGRVFTMAELRTAPEGKYSWDESGCVFEVNADGSVTVVGTCDPSEIVGDSVDELLNGIFSDGIPAIMPRYWAIMPHFDNNRFNHKFYLTDSDGIVNSIELPTRREESNPGNTKSRDEADRYLFRKLIEADSGVLLLLPLNAAEYILSMGVMAYCKRVLGSDIDVRISHPAVLCALDNAIQLGSHEGTVTQAFGHGEDYMCCDITRTGEQFEITRITDSSGTIPGLEKRQMYNKLLWSATFYSASLLGNLKGLELTQRMLYPVTFILKENDVPVKAYKALSYEDKETCRKSMSPFIVSANRKLALLIGDREIVSDIVETSGIQLNPVGVLLVTVEVSKQKVALHLKSGNNSAVLDIGAMIG